MADGKYAALYSFACSNGFCPPEICTCTLAGHTAAPQLPSTNMVGGPVGAEDYGLCQWTCTYGTCPSDLCTCSGSDCSGGGGAFPGTSLSIRKFYFPTNAMTLQAIKAELGTTCFKSSYCEDQTNNIESRCDRGEFKLGYDADGCEPQGLRGRSICCQVGTALRSDQCSWPSAAIDGKDLLSCDSQCRAGQVAILTSEYGPPHAGKCLSGKRAFCCDTPMASLASKGCYWTQWCVTQLCKTEIRIANTPIIARVFPVRLAIRLSELLVLSAMSRNRQFRIIIVVRNRLHIIVVNGGEPVHRVRIQPACLMN